MDEGGYFGRVQKFTTRRPKSKPVDTEQQGYELRAKGWDGGVDYPGLFPAAAAFASFQAAEGVCVWVGSWEKKAAPTDEGQTDCRADIDRHIDLLASSHFQQPRIQNVIALPFRTYLATMLVDTRNTSSNSLSSGSTHSSSRVTCCSRCAAPSSNLARQKLGIVPANANNSAGTNNSASTSGRTRDYLCTDCVRRERAAPVRLGYECPGWAYGRFGYRCPSLTFREEAPRIEALVSTRRASLLPTSTGPASTAAEYDIVFLAVDQKFGPRIHRRVLSGSTLTLTLEECSTYERRNSLPASGEHMTRDENGDVVMADVSASTPGTTQTCLRGVVAMDRRSAIADGAWIDGMTFLAAPSKDEDENDNNNDDANVPAISVAGFNGGGHLRFTGQELRAPSTNTSQSNRSTSPHELKASSAAAALHGQIRVVSSRAIVRSRPDSKATARRRCVRPAIFNTVEEADAILHRHRVSIAPFLCRNLGLPEGPARLVCEYWCDRPSPLMEFRPGDVVLTTVMPGRGFMNDNISTVLVARRRCEDA